MEEFTTAYKYKKAKNKVDNLRAFYIHFAGYIIFNTTLTTIKILDDLDEGKTLQEALFDFGSVFMWLVWGIGIAFHAFSVYGFDYLLGKNWESRKLQECMEEELRLLHKKD
ncbi:2TM domain-containing protein [Psychroserpens sp.]|uniref:2TM domain-containing protein n=1 Tax=Psychroserpens sp. TaxID=2020870 RepID=UPI002B272D85|nr:2TM domain-containing protein [Psychroserpens sp.]